MSTTTKYYLYAKSTSPFGTDVIWDGYKWTPFQMRVRLYSTRGKAERAMSLATLQGGASVRGIEVREIQFK